MEFWRDPSHLIARRIGWQMVKLAVISSCTSKWHDICVAKNNSRILLEMKCNSTIQRNVITLSQKKVTTRLVLHTIVRPKHPERNKHVLFWSSPSPAPLTRPFAGVDKPRLLSPSTFRQATPGTIPHRCLSLLLSIGLGVEWGPTYPGAILFLGKEALSCSLVSSGILFAVKLRVQPNISSSRSASLSWHHSINRIRPLFDHMAILEEYLR